MLRNPSSPEGQKEYSHGPGWNGELTRRAHQLGCSPFLSRTHLTLLPPTQVEVLSPGKVVGGGFRHSYWEARSLDYSRPGLVEGRVKSRGTPEMGILGVPGEWKRKYMRLLSRR